MRRKKGASLSTVSFDERGKSPKQRRTPFGLDVELNSFLHVRAPPPREVMLAHETDAIGKAGTLPDKPVHIFAAEWSVWKCRRPVVLYKVTKMKRVARCHSITLFVCKGEPWQVWRRNLGEGSELHV